MQNNGILLAQTDGQASLTIWDQVMRNLSGVRVGIFSEDAEKKDGSSRHARIRVLERLSVTMIMVLWQDATRCYYSDQKWIRCRARSRGVCALGGKAIRRDDIVYKPQARRRTVANGQAMILASEVAHELNECGGDKARALISLESTEAASRRWT